MLLFSRLGSCSDNYSTSEVLGDNNRGCNGGINSDTSNFISSKSLASKSISSTLIGFYRSCSRISSGDGDVSFMVLISPVGGLYGSRAGLHS